MENHIKRRELQRKREGDGKIKEGSVCLFILTISLHEILSFLFLLNFLNKLRLGFQCNAMQCNEINFLILTCKLLLTLCAFNLQCPSADQPTYVK